MKKGKSKVEAYLQVSDVIDWQHPTILELAGSIADHRNNLEAIAKACFEWVRDEIYHSVDYQMNPLTCCASDVLKYKTGYCFAKSHLLAALLRANQIPTGFCYQRLSLDDSLDGKDMRYSLHGFNAVYLPAIGWYRIDARGNRKDINAQFTPPDEQLAYEVRSPGEVDFKAILSEPLPEVIQALQAEQTWDSFLLSLPDRPTEI